MELADLKKSISEMTDDELRSLLLEVRQNRRTSKHAPPATKAKSELSMDALMGALTPEQAAILLKKMGG